MAYLICYDIEQDKKRKKISDRLLADGLEQVQYSVFMGVLSEPLIANLQTWLTQKVKEQKNSRDSVIIMHLQPQQIQKMCILGEEKFDKEELSGMKNTLFF